MDIGKIKKSYKENNIIGKRIKEARENRGWTQAKLTEKTDFEQSSISHYETGRRIPSAVNFIILSLVLGFSSDFLLGIRGNHVEIAKR